MENRSNLKNVAIVVTVAALSMLMFLGYDIAWDTSDDGTTAMILAHPDNNFAVFFPKFFTSFFSFLYALAPIVEWWLIGQLVTVFLSLIAILYVIKMRFTIRMFLLLSVPIAILTQLAIASQMNFTRTASFAATAGMLLIVHAVDAGGKHRVLYSAGTLLMLLGVCYRLMMAFTVLPLGAVAVMIIIYNKKNFNDFKGYVFDLFKQGKFALICAVLVVLFGLLYPLGFSDQEMDAVEYNTARAQVMDYGFRYINDENAADRYSQLGMTENDFNALFFEWLIADTDYFTTDFFQKLNSAFSSQIYMSQEWFSQISYFFDVNNFIFYAAFFVVVLIICADKKRLFSTALYLIILVTIIASLVLLGRINDRVLNSLLFSVIIFSTFLYGNSAGDDSDLPCFIPLKSGAIKSDRILKVAAMPRLLIAMLVTVVLFWGQLVVLNLLEYEFDYVNSPDVAPDVDAMAVYNYAQQNQDIVLVLPIRYLQTPALTYPLWMPKPTDSPSNLFFIGHWDAYMPYKFDRQALYDITNLQLSLTENENTVSLYSAMLHQYLKDHVHDNVTVSFIDSVVRSDGETFDLVQYCAPLDVTTAKNISNSDVVINKFSYQEFAGYDSFLLEGKISQQESDSYSLLYCNIIQNGKTFTYKVDIDRETSGFSANLFGLADDFNTDTADVELYARTIDGELFRLCSIA